MSGVHPQHWWPCCVLVALISMGRIWNFWWNLHLPLSLRDEAAFFAVWLFQGIDSTSEDRGQFFTRLLNEISSLLTNVPWNSGMGKTSQQLAAARAKTELSLLFSYELSKSPGWLLTSNMHAESSSVFIDLHLNAEFLFSYICLRSGGSQSRAEFWEIYNCNQQQLLP